MHLTRAKEYEQLLLAKYPEAELEAKLGEKVAEFSGLLTREAALFILAKENDLVKEEVSKIAELKEGMRDITVRATVERVFPVQIFEKGAKVTKSCRVFISDSTGQGTLVLWNESVNLLTGTVGMNDLVDIKGAYVHSAELHLGFNGNITVLEHGTVAPLAELKQGGFYNVRGKVTEVFPQYFYMKNNEEKVMRSFEISDGTAQGRVVVWHEPERLRDLAVNDEIKLENALFKNSELHVNNLSRIVFLAKAKRADIMNGKLEDVAIKGGDEVVAKISGSTVFFSGKLALQVLGVMVLPPDVGLDTVLSLKKEKLIGTDIAVRFKKQDEKLVALEII